MRMVPSTGPADRRVARVGRLLHPLGDDAGAALAGGHLPQAVGVRPEHLAQDHAGVAAGAEQRAAGQDGQRVAEGEVGLARPTASRRASRAAATVRNMLVPVSPSGTG